MMIRDILVTLTLAALTMAGPAYASNSEKFVRFFSGVCVRGVDNIEGIRSFAAMSKWKPITDNFNSMMAPPGSKPKGWAVVQDKQLFLVGITQGKHGKQRVNSCSVISKPQDVAATVTELKKRFDSTLIIDETEGYQRYQQFWIHVSGNKLLLTILSPTEANITIVNLSVQYFH